MSTHRQGQNMKADSEYIAGELAFLVIGNKCRLMDGRRTNGFIESYDIESAMFRWRITQYEDSGKCWDLPAEYVSRFQFEKDSKRLSNQILEEINLMVKKYQEKLYIEPNEKARRLTEVRIEVVKKDIILWLKNNSDFILNNMKLDIKSKIGSRVLAEDLKRYMKSINLIEIEEVTTNAMVLNPNSGEWIKGMSITLAELGLASYYSTIPRTKDIFIGIGSKQYREKYLIHRLAFVRAFFNLIGIDEVVLYRGMSTEKSFRNLKRTYLSCTFSLDVAKEFSDMDINSKYRNSYLLKMTCPVEKIFMTYYETESMNSQYKEAEAIIFFYESITI